MLRNPKEPIMSTVPVNLPDDLHEYVENKTKLGGFDSPGQYIASLVAAACEQQSGLEVALLTGLDSGEAREWATGEWDTMRSNLLSGKNE